MDLGIRLTADATVADGLLDHGNAPDLSEAADLMASAAHVTKRVELIATRVGQAHRDQMDETTLEQLRTAVRQLGAATAALTVLPTALDPDHPGQPRWPTPPQIRWREAGST